MNFHNIIQHYWPYWTLGILMITATLRSEYKDLMRFQPKSFLKFLRIMFFVTIFRCISMHFSPPTLQSAAPILQIPLALTSTVFWEDSCFTLPCALAALFLGDSIVSKIAIFFLTLMMQISFGLGHTYQGVLSAIMISFYIPYVTSLGKKHGFGTVMLCHMCYDFLTLLTVRLFLGV